MNKKYLEALNRLYECNDDDYTLGYQQHDYKLLQQALQRLEAIDQTKPSEALDRLEETNKIIHNYISNGDYDNTIVPSLDIIKQSLIKSQEQDFNYNKIVIPFLNELAIILGINDIDEMLDKIKEQKKVLEIIKPLCEFVETKIGIMYLVIKDIPIYIFKNREEFELLKRYFK